MYIPEESTSNGVIATITGIPAALFALSMSQTELAIVGLCVNVFLAIGLKVLDVYLRIYFEGRAIRKAAAIAAREGRNKDHA
jgi:hypothetical protein